MMVKMMSCRNQIWSGRKEGAKRPGPDLEGKMNTISYVDDNNDSEDDELQKPNLEARLRTRYVEIVAQVRLWDGAQDITRRGSLNYKHVSINAQF